METKFTPGPWVAVANGGDDPDERKLLVGKNDDYGDFTTVSDCRSKWLEDEIGGNEEANAHLIAAAPDLYEALQEACTSLVIASDQIRMAAKTDSRWTGVDENLLRYAREGQAVLDKARGES